MRCNIDTRKHLRWISYYFQEFMAMCKICYSNELLKINSPYVLDSFLRLFVWHPTYMPLTLTLKEFSPCIPWMSPRLQALSPLATIIMTKTSIQYQSTQCTSQNFTNKTNTKCNVILTWYKNCINTSNVCEYHTFLLSLLTQDVYYLGDKKIQHSSNFREQKFFI